MNLTENSTAASVFVVTHTIRPGVEKQYEDSLTEILGVVSSFAGYLGRNVFRPAHGKRTYTILVHFDSQDHLQTWIHSKERAAFIERTKPFFEQGDVHEIKTGLDFWFTPSSAGPPKRWKQFVLTVAAVYPLTLIIPRILGPIFGAAPALFNDWVRGFCIAAALTATLTFVVMPRLTRLLSRWLFAGAS